MGNCDEQHLGQRVDRALATITSGPVPAAAIVARGRRIRRRRRAVWSGVAVVAALAVAIPVTTAVRGGPSSRPAPPLATKMSGLPMPAGTNFHVLVSAGKGAAWYSTATPAPGQGHLPGLACDRGAAPASAARRGCRPDQPAGAVRRLDRGWPEPPGSAPRPALRLRPGRAEPTEPRPATPPARPRRPPACIPRQRASSAPPV